MTVSKDDSLSGKVVSGGIWTFSLRFAHQGLYIVKLIILAALLNPHDFGVIGIALLTLASLDALSQTGIQQSLVHLKGDIRRYLDSAWTFLILRGLALFAIVFVVAPYIALLFETPEATDVVRAVGILFIVQPLANIGVIYFQKELQFKRQFIYTLTGSVVDFAIAIPIAVATRSVWALVFGLLAGSIAKAAASYVLHSHRPRFRLDFRPVRTLFGYGKWVLGSSILMFIILQGDSIAVGYIVGAAALGLYQISYQLSNTPATEITHVISQVTFPAYSKLQDAQDRVRAAYIKVLKVTSHFSIFLGVMIFVLAPEFTSAFLGDKWMPMVPAMRILALAGIARSIAATAGPVFLGIGQPSRDTKMQLVRLLVMLALIVPLTTSFGIEGAAATVLLSISISGVGFAVYVIRCTGCGYRAFAGAVAYPTAGVLVVVAILLTTKELLPLSTMSEFIILASLGVLTYAAMTYLLDRFAGNNIISLLRDIVTRAVPRREST